MIATRLFPERGLRIEPKTNGNGKHPHVRVFEMPEQKGAPWTWYPPELFDLPGSPYRANTENAVKGLTAYAVSALAYACMTFRATKLVEAPLWVIEETDEGEEWLEQGDVDSDLAQLLEQPNPDMEMSDLLRLVSLYMDGTGAALLVKNRDRSGVTRALYPYAADEFTVEPDTIDGVRRLYGKFTVRTEDDRRRVSERKYGPDDVVYLANPDPRNVAYHLSPLDVALSHVNIGEQMRRTVLGILRRALRPGSVTAFKQKLEDTERSRFIEALNAFHAGFEKAGKNLMLEGDVTFEQLDAALKDLALGPVQGDVEAAVCMCFQIRPELIGAKVSIENGTGFADSLKPALSYFYDLFAFPTWSRIAKTLTRSLLREVDFNPLRFIRFDTTQVRALAPDMTARVSEANSAGKFWTVNERRVHTGKDPLPDDDERGEEIDSSAPAGGLFGFGDPGGREGAPGRARDEEEELDEEQEEEKKARRQRTRRAEQDRIRRRVAWAVSDALVRTQEMTFEIVAKRAIAEDQARVLAIVSNAKADPAGPIDVRRRSRIENAIDDYFKGESPERWRVLLQPILEASSRAAAERVAAELGVDFDLLQPGLLKFIEKETGWLITGVSETTRTAVRKAIAEGMEAGDGVTALAKRIREVGEFSPSRASLIARTEATRATNGAARESLSEYSREYGIRVEKEWLTAGDARVRDEHRAMEGERVGVDEPFSNGLQYPSEPNCRCTTLMHTVLPGEEPKTITRTRKVSAKRLPNGDLEAEITEEVPA
jgi:HK97 family phage portal protein